MHINHWGTKIFYNILLCIFQMLVFFNVPLENLIDVKNNVVRAREMSYLKFVDWYRSYHAFGRFNGRVDVVLAHYKEDLGWLSSYLGKIDRLYLYCKDVSDCKKGLPSDLKGTNLIIEYLPNEGRETNTYLYHILKYYNKLPDRTVFSMASLNGNWMRQLSFVYALADNKHEIKSCYGDRMFEKIRSYRSTIGNKSSMSSHLGDGYKNTLVGDVTFVKEKSLEDWMLSHIKQDIFKKNCRYGQSKHGAIFSVTRDDILSYSRETYQDIFAENSGTDLMEAGYFMERIWRFMFAHARDSKRD